MKKEPWKIAVLIALGAIIVGVILFFIIVLLPKGGKQKEEIVIANKTGEFNGNGWANQDFTVEIKTNGPNFQYCIGEDKCESTIANESSSKEIVIDTEGVSIYRCAQTISEDGNGEVVCRNQYKLDKTL